MWVEKLKEVTDDDEEDEELKTLEEVNKKIEELTTEKNEYDKNPKKTPDEFLKYIAKHEEWLEEDEPGACDMKGVMHSYNMYQSTMYPEILKNFKMELIAPEEIVKKLHKEGEVKDKMVMKEVTK